MQVINADAAFSTGGTGFDDRQVNEQLADEHCTRVVIDGSSCRVSHRIVLLVPCVIQNEKSEGRFWMTKALHQTIAGGQLRYTSANSKLLFASKIDESLRKQSSARSSSGWRHC
jgi:hypothetical protein